VPCRQAPWLRAPASTMLSTASASVQERTTPSSVQIRHRPARSERLPSCRQCVGCRSRRASEATAAHRWRSLRSKWKARTDRPGPYQRCGVSCRGHHSTARATCPIRAVAAVERNVVEAAGVEPASESGSARTSTCIARCLDLAIPASDGRDAGSASHRKEFAPWPSGEARRLSRVNDAPLPAPRAKPGGTRLLYLADVCRLIVGS
jgi:hypothetical protein